ncbi:zinc finger protein 626-like [Colias croceus]|uniref:zinc finger protein 626-like n=1 Tax=Colias crocea TaxID=72248 RepID=UPI001E27EC87|nr:zinc finger protein 626-like [Colias croceus]
MCLTNLSIAHNFKRTCILSEERLKNYLKIKIEKDYYEDIAILDDNIENDSLKQESEEVREICDRVEVRRSKRSISKNLNENKEVIVSKKKSYRKKSTEPRKLKKLKFRRLFCETCNIAFKTREQSEAHKKEFHKETSCICEFCGKVLPNRSAMYTHTRLHLPASHKCEHCSYCTPLKSDLKKHMYIIHTDIKLYQCSECPRSFKTSSNMKQHIIIHHKQIRKYACTMCDKRFYDSSKLQRHTDSHNSVRRHKCDICQAQFTRRCHWKRHLSKQHDIIIPRQRPGRQKMNAVIEKFCTNNNKNV